MEQLFPIIAFARAGDPEQDTGPLSGRNPEGQTRLFAAKYGINMQAMAPQVVRKLREKAASYDSCIEVAMWLTFTAYQMPNAPPPPDDIKA